MRALLTLVLFLAAAAGGGAYWVYSTQQQAGPPPSRLPALGTIPEPALGIELRRALERRDGSALGVLLSQEHQQQLTAALRPVVAITEIRLLKAVHTATHPAATLARPAAVAGASQLKEQAASLLAAKEEATPPTA